MRSFILFSISILCLSGAVYLALGAFWVDQSETPESRQKAAKTVVASLGEKVNAGDILYPENLKWIEVNEENVSAASFTKENPDHFLKPYFAVIRDMDPGIPLTQSDMISSDDPNFIAAITKPGKQVVEMSVKTLHRGNYSFSVGSVIDLYLSEIRIAQGHQVSSRGIPPIALAKQLRIVGVSGSSQSEVHYWIEGSPIEIQAILLGQKLGDVEIVLSNQKGADHTNWKPDLALLRTYLRSPAEPVSDRQIRHIHIYRAERLTSIIQKTPGAVGPQIEPKTQTAVDGG